MRVGLFRLVSGVAFRLAPWATAGSASQHPSAARRGTTTRRPKLAKEILKDAVVKVTVLREHRRSISPTTSPNARSARSGRGRLHRIHRSWIPRVLGRDEGCDDEPHLVPGLRGTRIDATFRPWYTGGSAGSMLSLPIRARSPRPTRRSRWRQVLHLDPIAGAVGDASNHAGHAHDTAAPSEWCTGPAGRSSQR